MRIAVVNTKGGVGKTTTAVHLAAMLSTLGPTLLIDADPQASAASWAAWRTEGALVALRDAGEPALQSPTTVCLTGRAVFHEGRSLAPRFDHVVVDSGGGDSGSLRGALLLAEQGIIPVGASSLDAAALTDVLEIANVARDINPSLRLRVLLARVDPRTRDAAEMLAYLAEQRLEVLDARVCERVAYRRAVGAGRTVDELVGAARDAMAVAESAALFREVLR